MVQWISDLQNNSFINPSWLPEKTGAIVLAQPGLMASRLAMLHLEIFKVIYWMKH